MKRVIGAAVVAAGLLVAPSAGKAQQYDFVYVTHAVVGQPFWLTVKLGMDEACKMTGARCQILWIQTRGNLDEELANLEAAIARKADGIVVTLPNPTLFNDAVSRAVAAGIPVISSNVDAPGNARQAYVGQDLEQAGYDLAKGLSAQFPKDGPVHALLGISMPGQSWAEQRGHGVERFLTEYKRGNPARDIGWKRLDSGVDLAVTGSRVSAYIQGNPDTNVYFDMGYWHAGVAAALREQHIPPGKVLLAGFDLVPQALNEMKSGYIQVQVDQQPYLQGFLPIMQLYLTKKYGLSGWDVNTGKALIGPADVADVEALAKKGLR